MRTSFPRPWPAWTDLVRLRGSVEGEGLELDHQLALFQQLGSLGEGLHGLAFGRTAGDPRAGCRRGREVGDRDNLRRFGGEADQVFDRSLAYRIEHRVDLVRHPAPAPGPPCLRHRPPEWRQSHGDSPGWPRPADAITVAPRAFAIWVAAAADPACATIDEKRGARSDAQQPQDPLGRFGNHAGRCRHSPIHGRRFAGPGVQNCILCLGVVAVDQTRHHRPPRRSRPLRPRRQRLRRRSPDSRCPRTACPSRTMPDMNFQSTALTLAARTTIRICPGPACGSGASPTLRTSGSPYSVN